MKKLIAEIKQCQICLPFLENGVNPVFAYSPKSKIIIIGQAPGIAVHNSGIPWHDKSGERLREWMGVSSDDFYNEKKIAIIPMGFCYPGKGKTGDNPPRKECAPLWHSRILEILKEVELTLLIGKYAQDYYLSSVKKRSLTETVRNFREYLPDYLPLPHPSPRNNIWMAKNQWFEKEVIPELQNRIQLAFK